jgi:2-polyprenyl-3-methyl-5-hydroxy-6-metoxy-1,4-benzoquinol methylase
MTSTIDIDPAKTEAFMGQLVGNLSGTLVTYMSALGDRLGLFRDLAESGPATSDELAERTGITERYAREWLSCLACAGYLAYDANSGRFALPPEHAPALAIEGHPMFMGGFHHAVLAVERAGVLGHLTEAFVSGKGIAQDVYGAEYARAIERLSAGWFDNLLVDEWLAALPDVGARLHAGADVADIGCGAGRAVIRLAEAFPMSRFTGFDFYAPAIAAAQTKALAAGVPEGRLRFAQHDAADRLPGTYDLVMAMDVLHDLARPADVIANVRTSLKPGGSFFIVEMNAADTIEGNAGPFGAMLYAISVLYCMSVSLAQGGAAVGTAGLPESRLRELCIDAGFKSLQRVTADPFSAIYIACT